MNSRKSFLLPSIALLFFVGACFSQNKPKVTVSPERVLHHDHVFMKGIGFSANSTVHSHLRRPDGTEFPVLQMLSNEKGAIDHEIDTLLLGPGTFEVWVDDLKSKSTSNVARFEVTVEQQKN